MPESYMREYGAGDLIAERYDRLANPEEPNKVLG